MADVQQQLSDLLGKRVKQIRTTSENPPRVSVIDLAVLATGKDQNNSAKDFRRLLAEHPEVDSICDDFRFPGKGQRSTKVTDARGVVEIIMLLPGRHAALVRRQAAELLVRYLGGDLTLVAEICRNRGLQEDLTSRAPSHPLRVFGEAVEAAPPAGSQLASLFAAMNQRLTNQEQALATQGQLLTRIHESLAHDRQRVNLNVRAPKRAAPHQPRISHDIGGARPFPVAKFLDAKERDDPSWKCARRSFAPTFGMQVQVLKKQRLRDEGKAAVYIEQNHRAQLLYTEEDRALMEDAWLLTSAHREDLAGRPGVQSHQPSERPSVLALLQRV